jgi:hypothetical protein
MGRTVQVPASPSPQASSGKSQYSFASQSHAAEPVSLLDSPAVVPEEPVASSDDPSLLLPGPPVDAEPPSLELPPSVDPLLVLVLCVPVLGPPLVDPSVPDNVVDSSPPPPSSPQALAPPSDPSMTTQANRKDMFTSQAPRGRPSS